MAFYQRSLHSSIVLGKYLYIHGGEIVTWDGGGSEYEDSLMVGTANVTTLPSMASIHLSSFWNNDTVQFKTIESSAPSLISQALWIDPLRTSFYAYDGGLSYSLQINGRDWKQPRNQLWQFTPSGSSGTWSPVGNQASSNFSDLARTINGIYAYGGGFGFALGGIENGATKVFADSSYWDTPGMVMYKLSDREWYNVSAVGYSPKGHARNGAAQFVPGFGPAGLVCVFGGLDDDGNALASDPVSMFDPESQQWSHQTTSGPKPRIAESPCVVGIQGDDDTYEIFLYGGNSGDNNIGDTIAQGAVYVLSLPAFHCERQDVTPTFGRFQHSCNVVGNRQMISVDGRVINTTESIPRPSLPDPWRSGIGIFDMTAMKWKANYDANAAPYVTPDVIKSYYRTNGRFPAVWDNKLVQSWFTKSRVTSNSSTTSGSAGPDHTSQSRSSGKKTGAIAGGTVGGLAALVLFCFLALIFIRRQRHGANEKAHGPQLPGFGDGDNTTAFMKTSRAEMSGIDEPIELPQREVAITELPTAIERRL